MELDLFLLVPYMNDDQSSVLEKVVDRCTNSLHARDALERNIVHTAIAAGHDKIVRFFCRKRCRS